MHHNNIIRLHCNRRITATLPFRYNVTFCYCIYPMSVAHPLSTLKRIRKTICLLNCNMRTSQWNGMQLQSASTDATWNSAITSKQWSVAVKCVCHFFSLVFVYFYSRILAKSLQRNRNYRQKCKRNSWA